MFFIYFIYLFLPLHGLIVSLLRKGSFSSSRLPVLRGSLPHARSPQLASPFRGPGDTGNWTRDLPISRSDCPKTMSWHNTHMSSATDGDSGWEGDLRGHGQHNQPHLHCAARSIRACLLVPQRLGEWMTEPTWPDVTWFNPWRSVIWPEISWWY